MLSKKYRFRGLGSVRPAMRHGSTLRDSDRLFTLKSLRRKGDKDSRIAVIVSRKTAKSAVQRNRIRRRFFEIFRLNWERVPSHTDIVAIVHDASVKDMDYEQLTKRIVTLLNKAG